MNHSLNFLWLSAFLLSASLLPAQNANQTVALKTAIFTANRADKSFDDKLPTLEDFVTSGITEKGYGVISREVATDAVGSFLKQNPRTPLDMALGNEASARSLAQMLQADYLLLVSISSFGTTEKKTTIGGKEVSQTIHTLRATYKLNEGILGASVHSATISATDTTMSTAGAETLDTDVINRLLEKAAAEIAAKMPSPPKLPPGGTLVEFTIVSGIMEAGGQTISLPDIRLSENRTVVIEKTPVPVLAVNATVELNGAAIGSTPDAFRAAPGLHKLKITHEQCEPWERTINISPGQKQKVVLQMTDKAYNRWKDQTAFLQTLENGRKLTDAEVEKVKGLAESLRRSHVAVDIKQDVKVDTTEGLKVYKSIY